MLREIPEDAVGKLLSDKESLAACDIAVFVHDRYVQRFTDTLASVHMVVLIFWVTEPMSLFSIVQRY